MKAKTITILNKLSRKDSQTGLDVWYKYTLNDISYKQNIDRTTEGINVNIGNYFTILIPFDANYKCYDDWKSSLSGYTLSQGDIIVLDDIKDEIVNPNTIASLKQKYKYKICEIRAITEVSNKFGVNIQFRVEGV